MSLPRPPRTAIDSDDGDGRRGPGGLFSFFRTPALQKGQNRSTQGGEARRARQSMRTEAGETSEAVQTKHVDAGAVHSHVDTAARDASLCAMPFLRSLCLSLSSILAHVIRAPPRCAAPFAHRLVSPSRLAVPTRLLLRGYCCEAAAAPRLLMSKSGPQACQADRRDLACEMKGKEGERSRGGASETVFFSLQAGPGGQAHHGVRRSAVANGQRARTLFVSSLPRQEKDKTHQPALRTRRIEHSSAQRDVRGNVMAAGCSDPPQWLECGRGWQAVGEAGRLWERRTVWHAAAAAAAACIAAGCAAMRCLLPLACPHERHAAPCTTRSHHHARAALTVHRGTGCRARAGAVCAPRSAPWHVMARHGKARHGMARQGASLHSRVCVCVSRAGLHLGSSLILVRKCYRCFTIRCSTGTQEARTRGSRLPPPGADPRQSVQPSPALAMAVLCAWHTVAPVAVAWRWDGWGAFFHVHPGGGPPGRREQDGHRHTSRVLGGWHCVAGKHHWHAWPPGRPPVCVRAGRRDM